VATIARIPTNTNNRSFFTATSYFLKSENGEFGERIPTIHAVRIVSYLLNNVKGKKVKINSPAFVKNSRGLVVLSAGIFPTGTVYLFDGSTISP
jgi:hypothetical protein